MAQTAKQPSEFGWLNAILDIVNVPRSLKAIGDLTYFLRQAGRAAPAHPLVWLQAARSGLRAVADAQYYDTVMQRIEQNSLWKQRGLNLYMLKEDDPLSQREVLIYSRLIQQLPIYKQLERGNRLALNQLRSDLADNFIAHFGNKLSDQQLQRYIDYVERLTGRGSLGALEDSRALAALGNTLFFSMRWELSKWQSPLHLIPAGRGFSWAVWREALKDHTAFFGTGVAILALAEAAGFEVHWDPRHPDFGKIKLGEGLRIDISGGYTSLFRAIWAALTGQRITHTGHLIEVDPVTVIFHYLRNKQTPQVGMSAQVLETLALEYGNERQRALAEQIFQGIHPQWMREDTFFGPFLREALGERWGRVADQVGANNLIPYLSSLFIADVVEAYKYGGMTAGIIALPAAFFGLGVQTFPDSPSVRRAEARARILSDPDIQSRLPEALRGKSYEELTPRARAEVNQLLREREPELVKEITEAARLRGDPFQRAADEKQRIRDAFNEEGFVQLERLWRAGEISPYEARLRLQALRNEMYAQMDAVEELPWYRDAENALLEYRARTGLPGDPLADLLSARPGTAVGKAIDFLGLRRAERPGTPLPGPPQNFEETLNTYRDFAAQAAAGRISWDAAEEGQQKILKHLDEVNPALGDLLRYETERRVNPDDPLLLQLYQASRPIVDDYYEWREEIGAIGNRWPPGAYELWLAYRMAYPQREAILYMLGYVREVSTDAAARIVHEMAPGLPITIRRR